MLKHYNTIIFNLYLLTLAWALGIGSCSAQGSGVKSTEGYTEVVYFNSKFFAIGSHGRIDNISLDEVKTSIACKPDLNLKCAFANEEILLIGSKQGIILYSFDGKTFVASKTGIQSNIYGITYRKGLYVAGINNGNILTSSDGITWNSIATGAKGNVISITANNSSFFGITSEGEILKSINGTKWTIQDYNKEYAGYYKKSDFRKIIASENSIVIIGEHTDGTPAVLFSTMGNIWTERVLVYDNEQAVISELVQIPNGITYDNNRDQFILACNNGEVLSLPTCSKCNKYAKISDLNLRALVCIDNYLMLVGDNYSFFILRL